MISNRHLKKELNNQFNQDEKTVTHNGLHGLRRLTWVDTFNWCIKPRFQRVWIICGEKCNSL